MTSARMLLDVSIQLCRGITVFDPNFFEFWVGIFELEKVCELERVTELGKVMIHRNS